MYGSRGRERVRGPGPFGRWAQSLFCGTGPPTGGSNTQNRSVFDDCPLAGAETKRERKKKENRYFPLIF